MDLWGHRLSSWILTETLTEAAKCYIEHHKSDFNDLEDFVDKTNKGQLAVGVARNMILSYQRNITKKS